MSYTMEQRLKKQQLLKADGVVSSLLYSTEKVDLTKGEIIIWLQKQIFTYNQLLKEALQAGKLTNKDQALLFDRQGESCLYEAWFSFFCCLFKTRPVIDRLGRIDCFTEGKGFVVSSPERGSSDNPGIIPELKLSVT